MEIWMVTHQMICYLILENPVKEILIKMIYQINRSVLRPEDVIENDNSFKPTTRTTTNADGTSTSMIPGPVTTKDKAQKKNYVKARSMLLMALPNEHQLTFNQYKDAKTLFDAIQIRFGGNDATRKIQKTLLKQMYENLNAPSTESLESFFNRLQKIVSQLAILVVWKNKSDLDTMKIDDLYNNFKIVEQEVKITVTSSSNSNSSSQNMAFVSSPSSTNEVNTANVQVSTTNSLVSTADSLDSTANLSDATVYAFLVNQPNGSQLVHEDLEQIHKDELEEMDLKWQLTLLSIRARRSLRNQDNRNRNQDSSRRTVNVEETSSKAIVAIDGAGFDWSFMADEEVPTNMALMAFSDLEASKSVCKDTSNEVKKTLDALLGKKLVSKNEKQIVFPTKIESVKQQEKPARKPVKYAEMYRSQKPRRDQRNWNNLKPQQIGGDFVMYNKACFEGMINGNNYTRVNYNYSVKKAHSNSHKSMTPRAILMKTDIKPLNTARPVNTAHPKTTVYKARP
ncbi:hypothetical protein Tco_1271081, partial [Tanacetum coccineum]